MAARDNKEKEAALPEGQAEKPKKKSRFKFIVIIASLLVILGGAGAGAYWWFFMRTPLQESGQTEAAAGEAPKAEAVESGAQQPKEGQGSVANARIERQSDLPRASGYVVPLPPVTVNLMDPSGRRYLKLGMEVEVNADVSAELKARSGRVRDAIITLLAGKTVGDVTSPDGKVLLRAEIAARLNQILGAQRVIRVYLTDFVVE